MKPAEFWSVLKEQQFTYFSGVPCSLLAPLLRFALADPELTYVPAVRENVALGVASGARLGGRKSGILIQNSGLGNIVNALTSFNLLYRVPVLIFIGWRGFEDRDAPEHQIMGAKTLALLQELGVPTRVAGQEWREEVLGAIAAMEQAQIPAAVLIPPGLVQ